jgi:hypothetical protein
MTMLRKQYQCSFLFSWFLSSFAFSSSSFLDHWSFSCCIVGCFGGMKQQWSGFENLNVGNLSSNCRIGEAGHFVVRHFFEYWWCVFLKIHIRIILYFQYILCMWYCIDICSYNTSQTFWRSFDIFLILCCIYVSRLHPYPILYKGIS